MFNPTLERSELFYISKSADKSNKKVFSLGPSLTVSKVHSFGTSAAKRLFECREVLQFGTSEIKCSPLTRARRSALLDTKAILFWHDRSEVLFFNYTKKQPRFSSVGRVAPSRPWGEERSRRNVIVFSLAQLHRLPRSILNLINSCFDFRSFNNFESQRCSLAHKVTDKSVPAWTRLLLSFI